MGCSPGDLDCTAPERPLHNVTIQNPFWIGQSEVTVGAYRKYAQANKIKMPLSPPKLYQNWGRRNLPMVNETWDEAGQYCAWVGGRLPTEAEWEFAARGGSPRARYGEIGEIAWFKDNAESQTHAVGQKKANGYGLLDAIGNVWEWVADWYDPNYYQASPAQDPSGPVSGDQKISRGVVDVDPKLLRVLDPSQHNLYARSDFFGFRCVWVPKTP